MRLRVLAKPEINIDEQKAKENSIKRARRLAGLPRPCKKFNLSNKEVQVVHVATAHLNMWLLDAAHDYPVVEELYNCLKALSCKYMDLYDREVAYAQKTLDKLSDNLPNKIISLCIKAGETETEWVDDWVKQITIFKDNHLVKQTEYEISSEDKKVKYNFSLLEPLEYDYHFDIEIQYVVTTINPLVFGLALTMVITYFNNIDLKLRNRWLRIANEIYFEVEDELKGCKDYSFKNSMILAKMYTDKMNTKIYPE